MLADECASIFNDHFDRVVLCDTRPKQSERTAGPYGEVGESAAGATALATGVRVRRRQVGVPDGRSWFAECCDDEEYKTALLTTCEITDATPASFVSYVKDRDDTNGIVDQLIGVAPDYIAGGYEEKFVFDRLSEHRDRGTFHLYDGCGDCNYRERRGFQLPNVLNRFLNKRTKDGETYAIVVEAGQIDRAGHDQNYDHLVMEIDELSEIVKTVFNYDLSNTIVLMTSDHDTGGLQLTNDGHATLTNDDHLGHMVPLFIGGGRSADFKSRNIVMRQSAVGRAIRDALYRRR
jgi:alkaline phosphatase